MKMSAFSFVRFFSLFVVCSVAPAVFAEPQLYETGPSEESSYVRFVNATDDALVITSSGGSAKVELNTKEGKRVSRFFPVKAGTKLSALVQSHARKVSVDVVGKPWEYVTIVVMPDGARKIKATLVRETPTDFNAMRSSVALFNLDAKCDSAEMKAGAKNVTVLEGVKPFSVERRLVNPVKLSATIACGSQTAGAAVDLSQLQAGERYSVFVLPLKKQRQAFFAVDEN